MKEFIILSNHQQSQNTRILLVFKQKIKSSIFSRYLAYIDIIIAFFLYEILEKLGKLYQQRVYYKELTSTCCQSRDSNRVILVVLDLGILSAREHTLVGGLYSLFSACHSTNIFVFHIYSFNKSQWTLIQFQREVAANWVSLILNKIWKFYSEVFQSEAGSKLLK